MSEKSILNEELHKWESSKRKKYFDYILEDSIIDITMYGQKFKIYIPELYPSKNDFMYIDYEDLAEQYNFLTDINNLLLEKRISSLYKLFRYINRKCRKLSERNVLINFNGDREDTILKDVYNIKEIKLRNQLEQNLSKMKSNLSSEDKNIKYIPKLFNENISGHILINEYMKCRGLYNDSEKITLDLVNSNVYHWILRFNNFSNKELQKELDENKFDCIELDIQFHDKLYPTYPPFVRIIKPKLGNRLMHNISGLKLFQAEYWSPSRSISFVIDKLYKILNKHALIDQTSNKICSEKYKVLEEILIRLSSLYDYEDNSEELDTEKYPKIYNFEKTSSKSSSKSKYWKAGTGYGTSSSSKWNIEEYIALQKEKDFQIQSILQKILEEIQNVQYEKLFEVYAIIEDSHLIPFIKSYFKGTSMLEIKKHAQLYTHIFNILQNMVYQEAMFLFASSGDSLFDLLESIALEAQQVLKIINANEDKVEESAYEINDITLCNTVINIYEIIKPTFQQYIKLVNKTKKEEEKKQHEKISSTKEKYINELKNLRFDMGKYNLAPDGLFRYSTSPKGKYISPNTNKKIIRRLANEFASLIKNLPIFYESSIFVRVDELNNRLIRVLITGPDNTPYDSGIFLFNLYIIDTYPENPPKMIHINNGGKRFNPNLYANGKVCLSLLGTWSGSGGENWNVNTSTLQQLFISAQSQILIDTPVFNEPGHESDIGSKSGDKKNSNYNQYIRYYTMCHSMVDMITYVDKYPEFKDVIVKHFKLKKEYILKTCKQWVDEAYPLSKSLQHNGNLNKEIFQNKYNELIKAYELLD